MRSVVGNDSIPRGVNVMVQLLELVAPHVSGRVGGVVHLPFSRHLKVRQHLELGDMYSLYSRADVVVALLPLVRLQLVQQGPGGIEGYGEGLLLVQGEVLGVILHPRLSGHIEGLHHLQGEALEVVVYPLHSRHRHDEGHQLAVGHTDVEGHAEGPPHVEGHEGVEGHDEGLTLVLGEVLGIAVLLISSKPGVWTLHIPRGSFLLSASCLHRSYREELVRHSVTEMVTNLVESQALPDEPAPAGLLVAGRDWAGVEDGDALGCSLTSLDLL